MQRYEIFTEHSGNSVKFDTFPPYTENSLSKIAWQLFTLALVTALPRSTAQSWTGEMQHT